MVLLATLMQFIHEILKIRAKRDLVIVEILAIGQPLPSPTAAPPFLIFLHQWTGAPVSTLAKHGQAQCQGASDCLREPLPA